MSKHQKVGVIVYTIDPNGEKRFLLRHNKPFNGYDDEWTITFGNVEDESLEECAIREVQEEYGIFEYKFIKDLKYTIEFTGKHGPSEIHFFAIEIHNIDIKIILNEESIGYDWVLIEKAKELMKYPDEYKALELISNIRP